MAESSNSLHQFDNFVLDVNKNVPSIENGAYAQELQIQEAVIPNTCPQNPAADNDVKSPNCISKFTGISEALFEVGTTLLDTNSQNIDASATTENSDSGIHDTDNNIVGNTELNNFFSNDQSFAENCGVLISDFSAEENDLQVKDEEFHDAVQFFKDPSSLLILENAGSSNIPAETLLARSSLYMKFDPLHAKYFSQTSIKPIGLEEINENEAENVSFKIESVVSDHPENYIPPYNIQGHIESNVIENNKMPYNTASNIELDNTEGNFVAYDAKSNFVPDNAESIIVPDNVESNMSYITESNIVPDNTEGNVPDSTKINVPYSTENNVPNSIESNLVPDDTEDNMLPDKMKSNTMPDIPDNIEIPEVVNKHLCNVTPRQSLGNILISFDSPVYTNKVPETQLVEVKESGDPVNILTKKLYTEEEMQQALKKQELYVQEKFLKEQHDLDLARSQKLQELEAKLETQTGTLYSMNTVLKDTFDALLIFIDKEKALQKKLTEAEKEKEKLKKDLKVSIEDLQSVEGTFSDFHKRYEQCKGMIKVFTQNEENYKQQLEAVGVQLCEKDEMYKALQSRTQDMLDKANTEVANTKKASDAQVAVLKAQLKKAELKISSLESDVKHIRIENGKLSSICDELMDKVSET